MDERKKTYKLIDFMLILLLVVLLLTGWNQKKQRAMAASTVETYTVQSGDTLWSISKHIVGKGKDPREMIFDIEKLNNIDASIQAGQTIKIPMEGK